MADITFVAEAHTTYITRSNTSVTNPGVLLNDYILLHFLYGGPTPVGFTLPSGFSLIAGTTLVNAGGFYVESGIYAKRATASEPGSWDTISASQTDTQADVTIWRGVDLTTPLDVAPASNSGSGTTYTYNGVTTVTNRAMLVIFGHDWGDTNNNLTPPTGFTERTDLTISYGASKLQSSAGATGNFTMTNNSISADPWATFTIALRPVSNALTLTSWDGTAWKSTELLSWDGSATKTTSNSYWNGSSWV